MFDQVVSQLLDGVGALTGLNLIVVNTNEDGLAGLDANNTSGTLLAVDGALVSTESDVVNTTNVEARSTNTVGILEGSNEGLNFGGLDAQTGSNSPDTTFLAEDGSLSNSLGTNQVVVDVCLPAHCCCKSALLPLQTSQ